MSSQWVERRGGSEKDWRELVAAALRLSGDFELRGKELRVIFNPLSARSNTTVLALICAEVTKKGVSFPGTDLVLCYEVKGYEPIKT